MMRDRERTVKSVQLETWCSPEVKTYVQMPNHLAIIPLGSFEQHGPHAPLGTDTFICFEICHRLAVKLGGVVLPPVWFSISPEHMDFAGTVTISADTLSSLLAEVVLSLQTSGFRKIIILNGHGGNEEYLSKVRERIADKLNPNTALLVLSYWDRLSPEQRAYLCSLEWGLHANAWETSLICAIFPSMVRKLKGMKNFPDVAGVTQLGQINREQFRNLIRDSSGIWGDPEMASAKRGRLLLSDIESSLLDFLSEEFGLSGSSLSS